MLQRGALAALVALVKQGEAKAALQRAQDVSPSSKPTPVRGRGAPDPGVPTLTSVPREANEVRVLFPLASLQPQRPAVESREEQGMVSDGVGSARAKRGRPARGKMEMVDKADVRTPTSLPSSRSGGRTSVPAAKPVAPVRPAPASPEAATATTTTMAAAAAAPAPARQRSGSRGVSDSQGHTCAVSCVVSRGKAMEENGLACAGLAGKRGRGASAATGTLPCSLASMRTRDKHAKKNRAQDAKGEMREERGTVETARRCLRDGEGRKEEHKEEGRQGRKCRVARQADAFKADQIGAGHAAVVVVAADVPGTSADGFAPPSGVLMLVSVSACEHTCACVREFVRACVRA